MFGIELVLVKPLLYYVLSLWGQRNNLFQQVDGWVAHMTDTTWHQSWQSTPPTRSCWIHPWSNNKTTIRNIRSLLEQPLICRYKCIIERSNFSVFRSRRKNRNNRRLHHVAKLIIDFLCSGFNWISKPKYLKYKKEFPRIIRPSAIQ